MADRDDPALPPLAWPLLQGRSAIITGGAGGIGRATARLFAAQGARVAVIDTADETEAFAAELGEAHLGLRCDVADEAAVDDATERVNAAFGGLDILVTMAGPVHPGEIGALDRAAYDQMLEPHLRGTFNMCQAALPLLRRNGGGAIVCMSSIAAERGGGLRGGAHYAAAKGGILGLTRAMARQLAPENIRANAVCPGAIHTGRRDYGEMNRLFGGMIPMGRVGTAEEVARTFLFLASDLSTYLTGAVIDINGGMHIH